MGHLPPSANAISTSVSVPNHFNNVRFSDGSRRVVLDNELGHLADCVDVVSTVPVGSDAGQYFHVELPNGGGSATLKNVLDLRAAGLVLEVTAPTATDLPPHTTPNTDAQFPTVPEFTFFVYDHLGNTRVMYHNDMYECQAFRTHYVLEQTTTPTARRCGNTSSTGSASRRPPTKGMWRAAWTIGGRGFMMGMWGGF